MKLLVEKPDYRDNDSYQFIVGYGGGMQTVHCVHLTREEIIDRLTEKAGPGKLIDDGENLYWDTEEK